MKKATFKMRHLAVATSLATAALAMAPVAQADVTGNVNVVSKYVLRGITTVPENAGAAVQGGFDYSHSSGIYAGYWGSSLDYVNSSSPTAPTTGFESDLYAGYKGTAGPLSYGVGVIYYAYTSVADADVAEVALTAGIGNASLGVNYLTKDVIWGNEGDTFFNLGYSQALPSDFTLAGSLMYYMYTKDGTYITASPTAIGSGFRGASLTLSHPFGKTGATMGLTAVGGGQDRNDVYQKPMMVLSLGATF